MSILPFILLLQPGAIELVEMIIEGHPWELTATIIGSILVGKIHMLGRRFRYGELNVQALVYALEKSLGNGFSGYLKEKRDELLKKENFINDYK